MREMTQTEMDKLRREGKAWYHRDDIDYMFVKKDFRRGGWVWDRLERLWFFEPFVGISG